MSIRQYLLVAATVVCVVPEVYAQNSSGAATRELHALFDEAWERDMREDPLRATYLGDRRFEREWPDVSQAAIDRRNAANAQTLAKLQRINREALSEQDRLSYDLFAWEYRSRIAAQPFKPHLYELRARDGV